MHVPTPPGSPSPRLTRRDTSSGREYIGTLENHAGEAKLELSRVNPELYIAAHTEVPSSMAGMGVGAALVQRLIDDARSEGFRIIPLCPFVSAQYRRHPEWADVMR